MISLNKLVQQGATRFCGRIAGSTCYSATRHSAKPLLKRSRDCWTGSSRCGGEHPIPRAPKTEAMAKTVQGLRKDPADTVSAPRFFYAAEPQEEAFNGLFLGLLARKRILVLLGEPGVG